MSGQPRDYLNFGRSLGKPGEIVNSLAKYSHPSEPCSQRRRRKLGVKIGGSNETKVSHKKEKDGRAAEKAPLSFHAIRHATVTMLKEAGMPAAVVMKMLGDVSEQMSAHHTHLGSESLKNAADWFPVFFRKCAITYPQQMAHG